MLSERYECILGGSDGVFVGITLNAAQNDLLPTHNAAHPGDPDQSDAGR